MTKENHLVDPEEEPTLEQLGEELKIMQKTIKDLTGRLEEVEGKLGRHKKIYADQSGVVMTGKERQGIIKSLH